MFSYGQILISKTDGQTIFLGPEQVDVHHLNVCNDYIPKLELHIAKLELQIGNIDNSISSFKENDKLNRKDKKALSKAQRKINVIKNEIETSQVLLTNWTNVLKQEKLKLDFIEKVNNQANVKYEISTDSGIFSPSEYSVQVGQVSGAITVTESIPVSYTPKKTETSNKRVITKTCSSSSCGSGSSSTVVEETKITPASVYFKQSNGLAYSAEGCPVGFEYNRKTSSCDRQHFIMPANDDPDSSINIVRISDQQPLELLGWTELEDIQIAKSE